jgi:predicted nuclease of predicted toxin-antitoxin system
LRIKLDENLPVLAADVLRQMGHDVDTVNDERLSGADDPRVIAAVTADDRALLTLDKGLADVRAYPPANHAGILLLRPKTSGPNTVMQFVKDHLGSLANIDPRGRLIVISEAGMRLR